MTFLLIVHICRMSPELEVENNVFLAFDMIHQPGKTATMAVKWLGEHIGA